MCVHMRKLSLLILLAISGSTHAMDTSKQESASPLKLAILVSGTGSNMEAILSHIEKQRLEKFITPAVIISNRKDARALKKAQLQEHVSFTHAVPTEYLPVFKTDKPDEYSQRLIACLQKYAITPENGLICLAGFMKLLDGLFVSHFKDRIINLHPSLLPAFPGGHAITDALEYGVKITGCTVHFVDEGMDTGTIIMQRAVQVAEDDTEDSLATKIHEAEHIIFPKVVELFAQGKIRKEDRKAFINN